MNEITINRLLLVLMSALGIGAAIFPVVPYVNPSLVKGVGFFLSGILSRLVK